MSYEQCVNCNERYKVDYLMYYAEELEGYSNNFEDGVTKTEAIAAKSAAKDSAWQPCVSPAKKVSLKPIRDTLYPFILHQWFALQGYNAWPDSLMVNDCHNNAPL